MSTFRKIIKDKYGTVKNAIIEVLKEKDELSFYPLIRAVAEKLKGKFEGSIGWHTTTVKLDLEVRRVLDYSRGKNPEMIRLAKAE